MKKDKVGARTYVETLRDQTEQYAQSLLQENEKLRVLALTVETENKRLADAVRAARDITAATQTLREKLEHAESENRQLQVRLDVVEAELDGVHAERRHIAEQLAKVERDGRGMADQYATAMRQNASLANLYVSSFMLHSTLDHSEVLSGIAQIIINIVGSEDYAIFERDGDDLHVVARAGTSSSLVERTKVGTGVIGKLASEARVRVFSPEEHTDLVAFVPLVIGQYVTGAIAVFQLLPQKAVLDDSDREIFEMLAAHAATALYCSSLHAHSQHEVSRCDPSANA